MWGKTYRHHQQEHIPTPLLPRPLHRQRITLRRRGEVELDGGNLGEGEEGCEESEKRWKGEGRHVDMMMVDGRAERLLISR